MRVLIVEDEPRLREALVQIMKGQKYQVDAVDNGADGLIYALAGEYDVVILDIMLPKMSGTEAAHRLRSEKNATPVLMLTARDEVSDKVKGLDSGADDYMTKPFSTDELLARIRALARRQGEVVLDELVFADLRLRLNDRTLFCADKSVRLGFKEHEVLRLLLACPGLVVSKEDLLTRVWGAESDAEDNNVEAYISFLRKKLTYLASAVRIDTVRKAGYRLESVSPC